MSENRNRSVYSETNDRRVFRNIHIRCVTGCCLRCRKRERRKWYRIIEKTDGKIDSKYPSWKLVSKNRKQWMKKPLKFDEDLNFSRIFITIEW